MNHYNLLKDEEELLNPVRAYAREELIQLCNKSLESETTFPKDLFSELSKLGLAGLSIGEQWGGVSGSPRLQAAVFDLLASVNLGPAIFTSVHGMVSSLIEKFGTAPQKEELLPQLASGEKLGAFALSEPQAGSDASNLSAQIAEQQDGSFVLNGEKSWITSAGAAHVYLVFARLQGTSGNDGVTALLLPHDSKGLTVSTPEKKMGCELSPIASLSFQDVAVPKEAIMGAPGEGMKIAYGGLTGGRINIAACANGISRTALRTTLSYISERKAFDQTLADFQGVQFKLAEMKTALDAATLLVRDAAERHEKEPKALSTRTAAAEAKLFATDTAMWLSTDAVQLHGAMGYMKATGIERLMRDAKMLQIVEGANEIQKGIIARALLENAS